MRQVNEIIIHCAATPNGKHFTVEDIDRWHKERGFRRKDSARKAHRPHLEAVGYHFVLYTGGEIAPGRHVDEIGAHAVGHNAKSVGVCLVGTDRFTERQWRALKDLLATLEVMYPQARVIGHRDVSDKSCPGFSVADYLKEGPAHGSVLA